jgi:predicted transcriptional regulator
MSAISIRLPDSLHKKVRELAKKDNVSINQMITIAVAEKLSAIETEDYLDKRAKKGSKEKFLKVLKKVPNKEPEIMDRI